MADTQAIKDRIDIVQLIGEYIPLKKAGANWKANCPFHHEKSPSFMVHPEKQIWHCFGCHKGGDIFSFFQEIEGLEFIEALKLLAQRAGVKIDNYKSEMNQSKRNRLLEINAMAAYFFHNFLLEIDSAEVARQYLKKRQLTQQTIKNWQIGYIADQWDLLTKYLLKKGFGIEDLVDAGLTIRRDGAEAKTGRGYYDRFRGRIMFPITDVHGNIVGFTGRVLVETDHSGGKYVNTPQTLLYDKSRILYGIHKAKIDIKTKDAVVLVEGQMDVIACHQAGMANVVAASGTALTVEQIKLIKRYTNNITMAFDADMAGQNAGKRGIILALEAGMRIKVIELPADFAKDPDECIKKDPVVWLRVVSQAQGVVDWHFKRALHNIDRNNFEKVQQAATTLVSEILHIPYPVERDQWFKRLADELGIDSAIIREEAQKIQRSVLRRSSTDKPISQTPAATIISGEFLLSDLWSLLLNFPEHYATFRVRLIPYHLPPGIFAGLYEKAESIYNKEQKLDILALRQITHQEGAENIIDTLLLKPVKNDQTMSTIEAAAEIELIFKRLREERRKQRGKDIQRALYAAEKQGDKPAVEALLKELQSL